MANKYTYRHGQRQLVKFAVDSATVIEIGDIVYLDTDDVKPASSLAWDTDKATTQADLAEVFAGIAVESSASGDTDEISVDISPVSVYEFTVANDTYEAGAPLGPSANGTTNLLKDTLEDAAEAAAIARCYKRVSAAATKCYVTFASAINNAANNVNGQLG